MKTILPPILSALVILGPVAARAQVSEPSVSPEETGTATPAADAALAPAPAAPEGGGAPVPSGLPQPPPPPPPPPPPRSTAQMSLRVEAPPPPRRRAGVREHDGFYLRLGTGFGAYTEGLSSDDEGPRGEVEGRSTGFAVMTELAIGGTVSRGFVLGGGVYNADVLASRLSIDEGDTVPDELDTATRNFTLIGPFGDWYFDPHEGFHAQAALGFAQLHGIDVSGGNVDEHRYHASGVGLMLGAGYEWWVGEQWSLGILGRLMAAAVIGQDDDDLDWFHGISTFPAVLLSITHH